MILTGMTSTAQRAANVRNNDSAVYNSRQSLEALVDMLAVIDPLCRFLHQGLVAPIKSDAPAVHVLPALFRKYGQVLLGRIINAGG